MYTEIAKRFKPTSCGESDKYSWHLYERMKMFGRERVYLIAQKVSEVLYEPRIEDLKSEVLHPSKIAIGKIGAGGNFYGRSLDDIFLGYVKYDNHFWSNYRFATHKWKDITEWFWKRYENYGRCAFLGDYSHEWEEVSEVLRKCIYCEKYLRRVGSEHVWEWK